MFTEANKYLQFLPVLHFQLTRSFLFTSEVAFGTLSVSVLSLFVYLMRPDEWNRRRKTKHKVKEDSCGMHRKCCIYQNTFIGSRASKFRWYGIRFYSIFIKWYFVTGTFVSSLLWTLLKPDNRGKRYVHYWWIVDARPLNKVIKDWESLNFVYFWHFNWFKIHVHIHFY